MIESENDVVILGAGPAGLSAALWADELGIEAVVLESESDPGGQLNFIFNAIENHLGLSAPNGKAVLETFLNQLSKRKIDIRYGKAVSKLLPHENRLILKDGSLIAYRALIIATGVSRRKLNIPGENEFTGKGILFSGKRDHKKVVGQTVVVVGGGDAAFENALILSDSARKVVVIHRRDSFTARREFVEAVEKAAKVEILTNSTVAGIGGAESVEFVEIENVISGIRSRINTDAVVIRIGVSPNSEFVSEFLERDDYGYISVSFNCETNIPVVFAVGDVANRCSPTISSAVGMGSTALKAIEAGRK